MASEAETEKKTAAVEAPTGDADIDKEDGWVREIRRQEVQERTEGGGHFARYWLEQRGDAHDSTTDVGSGALVHIRGQNG